MRASALLAFALAACSGPAATAPPQHRAAAAPTTPAPAVTRAGELRAHGLPAVARDGSLVVYAQRLSDGLRGMPNLTLFVRDRADRAAGEHVVVSVAEADQFLDDMTRTNPALDARVAAANRWLADRHARDVLEPMTAVGPGTPVLGQQRVARGALAVTWEHPRLRITDGDVVLVDRTTPASWLVEPYVIGTGQTCEHPPYLAGAHVDLARKLALVRIGFAAPSDMCGEPSDQLHVIAW